MRHLRGTNPTSVSQIFHNMTSFTRPSFRLKYSDSSNFTSKWLQAGGNKRNHRNYKGRVLKTPHIHDSRVLILVIKCHGAISRATERNLCLVVFTLMHFVSLCSFYFKTSHYKTILGIVWS